MPAITRRRVIWLYGPTCFGIPIAFINTLGQWSRDGISSANLPTAEVIVQLSVMLIIGYIGGALTGWLWWSLFQPGRDGG